MKFLRSSALLVAGMLAFTLGFSQDPNKIIKDSKAKFNSLTDLTARVTYTLSNANASKPEVKSGNVWMKKSKYKLIFTTEEIYCNGVFIWSYVKSKNQATKIDFDPAESLSADRVFKIYEEESKAKYEGLEGTRHKISVFSSKETADIWKTTIWVNKTTNLIEKATLYARNGSTYTYELSTIQVNTGVPDTAFNYDEATAKKAGITINDLTGDY